MKNVKILIMVICILTIFLGFNSVSAADNVSTDTVINPTDNVTINEVTLQSNNVNDNLVASNLGDGQYQDDYGTFTDLEGEIDKSSNGQLNITRNYKSNSGSDIDVYKNITIWGNGYVLDAHNENGRFLQLHNTCTVTIYNMNFKNYDSGWYNGGIYINSGSSLKLVNCTFTNNHADFGGAIFNFGSLTVINSTFIGNRADKCGGAIYTEDHKDCFLSVIGSTFINNTADNMGGAIFSNVALDNINNTFNGNKAVTGANNTFVSNRVYDDLEELIKSNVNSEIFLDSDYTQGLNYQGDIVDTDITLDISGSIIIDGQGHMIDALSSSGRFLYLKSGANVILKNIVFANFDSGLYSGSIYVSKGASLTLINCSFVNNHADYGGAIYNEGTLNVTNSYFIANSADKVGGAIYSKNLFENNNNTFTKNTKNSLTNDIYIEDYSFSVLGDLIKDSIKTGNLILDQNYYGGTHSDINLDLNGGSLTIDGNGYVLNAGGTSGRFLDLENGNLTIKNMIFYGYDGTWFNEGTIFSDFIKGIGNNINSILNAFTNYKLKIAADNGAVYVNKGASLTLINCSFINNYGANGGAIYNEGNLKVINSSFLNNSASKTGAAIYSDDDFENINNTFFLNHIDNSYNCDIFINKYSFSKLEDLIESSNGTITLDHDYSSGGSGDIDISKDIIINGNGHTLDSGASANRIYIHKNANVTLNNLTVKNVYWSTSRTGMDWVKRIGEIGGTLLSVPGLIMFSNPIVGSVVGAIELISGTVGVAIWESITSDWDEGAIYVDKGATLNLENCIITNNTLDYGGGVYNNGGTLTLKNTLFYSNTAVEQGSCIYSTNNHVYFKNTTVMVEDTDENNKTVYVNTTINGAIYLLNNSPDGNVFIEPYNFKALKDEIKNNGNNTLVLNHDYTSDSSTDIDISKDIVIDGQGHILNAGNRTSKFIDLTGNHNVTIYNTNFVKYGSNNYNGFIYVNEGSTLTLINCTFSNNTACNGGIYNKGKLILINCTFSNNKADSGKWGDSHGGAIYNDGGNLIINNTLFVGNTAVFYGGAIYNKDGTITINNCSFIQNMAKDGGAIYNELGTLIISNSNFSLNMVEAVAGAIYNNGVLNETNNTYAVNLALAYNDNYQSQNGYDYIQLVKNSGNNTNITLSHDYNVDLTNILKTQTSLTSVLWADFKNTVTQVIVIGLEVIQVVQMVKVLKTVLELGFIKVNAAQYLKNAEKLIPIQKIDLEYKLKLYPNEEAFNAAVIKESSHFSGPLHGLTYDQYLIKLNKQLVQLDGMHSLIDPIKKSLTTGSVIPDYTTLYDKITDLTGLGGETSNLLWAAWYTQHRSIILTNLKYAYGEAVLESGLLCLVDNYQNNRWLNYSFSLDTVNDLHIFNKTLTIDGEGFTWDAGNTNARFLYVGNGSNITLKNMVFTGFVGDDKDGAIYVARGGSLTLINCTFIMNSAKSGGAVYSEGNLNIMDCSFINNTADTIGGAVLADSMNKTSITGSSFSGNFAWISGGAILFTGNKHIDPLKTELGNSFYNNTILNDDGDYVVNNVADLGGSSNPDDENQNINDNVKDKTSNHNIKDTIFTNIMGVSNNLNALFDSLVVNRLGGSVATSLSLNYQESSNGVNASSNQSMNNSKNILNIGNSNLILSIIILLAIGLIGVYAYKRRN